MDVVPGSEQLFHPLIKDHKMYGRGAYDMKMAIACYLLLISELGEQLNNYNFGVMLTSDEEIGGMNGVKRLLQEGYASETALLPDGGFDWNFERMAKGILQLVVQSHGQSAHGSRPWLGRNAINQLIEVLREINLDFEKEKTLRPGYYSTVNVGLIQGGEATNQVPSYAEAKLDIRFPPSFTQEQLYKKVEDIVKRHPEVSTEVLISALPYEADIDLPPFQIFRKYAYELYGIEIGSTQSHGASDARFFGEKHIPVLVIAPTGGDIHSEGEWIDLNDLVRFYEVMKAWVKQISRR
jgi:succinyl-diaminopimelate desuccinylase